MILRGKRFYMHEKLVIVPEKEIHGEEDFKRGMVCAGMPVLFICDVGADFICGAGNYFCHHLVFSAFRSDIEYEYTYYDGEFRFARIKAKRKRKGLEESRWKMFLHWHRRGTGVYTSTRMTIHLPVSDLTSGESGTKIYELVFKGKRESTAMNLNRMRRCSTQSW